MTTAVAVTSVSEAEGDGNTASTVLTELELGPYP